MLMIIIMDIMITTMTTRKEIPLKDLLVVVKDKEVMILMLASVLLLPLVLELMVRDVSTRWR